MLGRVLMVDEQLLTVIGVAAPGFHGVEVETPRGYVGARHDVPRRDHAARHALGLDYGAPPAGDSQQAASRPRPTPSCSST